MGLGQHGVTFGLVLTEGEDLTDEEWGERWKPFSHINWSSFLLTSSRQACCCWRKWHLLFSLYPGQSLWTRTCHGLYFLHEQPCCCSESPSIHLAKVKGPSQTKPFPHTLSKPSVHAVLAPGEHQPELWLWAIRHYWELQNLLGISRTEALAVWWGICLIYLVSQDPSGQRYPNTPSNSPRPPRNTPDRGRDRRIHEPSFLYFLALAKQEIAVHKICAWHLSWWPERRLCSWPAPTPPRRSSPAYSPASCAFLYQPACFG